MQAARMKRCSAENEDGCIDEEREEKGHGRIDYGVLDGFATTDVVVANGARLHNARMKVEVVGHHRCANDADGDVEHFPVAENLDLRNEAVYRFKPQRAGDENFIGKANGDRANESDNESFNETEAAALECEDQENVKGSNDDTEEHRKPEKKFQGDGRAQDFGKIARGDGQFTDNPKKNRGSVGIVVAAGLSEIASCGDAELGSEGLEETWP